jgi:hypothetical protein
MALIMRPKTEWTEPILGSEKEMNNIFNPDFQDFIHLKTAAGRNKDLDDLEHLEKTN